MSALSALAMFQANPTVPSDVHLLMIAQWIMAICMVVVILGLVITAVALMAVVRRVEKKVEGTTKTVQGKVMPLIVQGQDLMTKVQEIVADLKPKIASVSSDVTHMSSVVKAKVDEAGQTFTRVNETVQDVNAKSKAQVQRVNGMVSDALTTTEHVSKSIQHGIKVPIQKIAGWIAAARAGIETLAEKMPWVHHATTQKGPANASNRPTTATPFRPGGTTPGGPPFVPGPDYPRGR